ncbi:hypothetical protein ILUMI_12643 [Ignelater luminosus]|uniref:NACHT domain-containing protein n=1 Tax=Ignelater luminosus TaxID=2038154 RepID=A0A8K0G9D5_IGNLU|nr:hypothetical protein ILUMI_12643 [Ignelater luminosus]
MANEEPICFEIDHKLILSNPDFDKELDSSQYDPNKAKITPFPNDYTLAVFADLAYKSHFYSPPDDWKLLTTATNKASNNGYFGVAFWNPTLCHVTVAHRGTEVSTIGALIADVQLSLNAYSTRQSQSAATFLHLVSEQIKKKNETSDVKFQLSITGHSLGAWLAQISTFTVKYFKVEDNKFVEDKDYLKNIHVHTVVFESPGCKEALSKLSRKFVPRYVNRKFGNFNNLDMTVYLSKLNPINSINHHVGTIYMVKSKTHAIKEIIGLFDYKTRKIERKIVLDFKSGMWASGKLVLKYLLPSSWTKQRVMLETADDTEYSLNVFTEDELDFINDWNYIQERDSINVKNYKKDKGIPKFTVKDEYNMIKAQNFQDLITTIACVKYLRPTKETILNLLESDVHDQVHLELFKLEAKHFQKHVLKFQRYYFKDDRYGLKKHLETDGSNILHILIDKASTLHYELETSIVNNVLMNCERNDSSLFDDYFMMEDHCFAIVNWNLLYKAKQFLSKIIGRTKDKINLLIIECFEVYDRDQSVILKSLVESGAKVILLSAEKFYWLHGKNIKKVDGFGSNIKFQDLIEESQQEFRRQLNLSLYGKTMSLNDILEETQFQTEEVYEYLNKTVFALLEFMVTPLIGPVIMDCPYNNMLQNVVFLDLYHEIDIEVLLSRSYDERSLFIIEDKEKNDLLSGVNIPNIKVQPTVKFEDECMQNFDKIIYLLKTKKGKLCLIKIFNKNFYVSRNIVHNHTVNQQLIFNSSNSDLDFYFFCGDESKYKMLYSQLDKKRKNHYNFRDSIEEGKRKIQNLENQETGHLFRINEDKIEWLYSRGSLNLLRKHMRPNTIPQKETEIINHYQQIIIISGEPGMGKSSTVGHLFLSLQQTHWLFAVPLRNSRFDDIDNNIDFDLIAKFILRSCNMSSIECLQYLLSYCLKHKTKLNICLMFDGFDEIPTYKERDKFVELINFLKENSSVKILITTRKFACKALENGLSVLASHYEIIDYDTKILDFFSEFQYSQWQLFKQNIDIGDINTFIRRKLDAAPTIFGETITNFIGIPMQMRMLAEVITLLEPYEILDITLANILNLYQKYTEMHYSVYFRRSGISTGTTINEWLKECIFIKLSKLAIIKLFNLDINYIKQIDIDELNRVGLIQSDYEYNCINFEFLHDSVRDFFIAQLLKLWLECQFVAIHHNWNLEVFIVSNFLTDGKYREARFFLNCYLKNLEITENRLNVCRDKLLELLEDNPNLLLNNESQESVFHICVNEDLCYLLKYFLFQVIDNMSKKELLSKRNSELQTPLFLAIRKAEANSNDTESVLLILLEELDKWNNSDMKTILVSTLFTYDVTSTDINKLKRYSNRYTDIIKTVNQIEQNIIYITLFLDACKENDFKKVNEILENFKNDKITRDYLLLTTNNRKETCLHLTTNKDIAEKLLKLGCDMNMQDNHGMTPLTRAIKNKQTDIAIKLINKGASNIPDYFGFTGALHAAKYGNLEVLKLLNSRNVPNVNVDERNVFGVTPLMIATKYKNVEIVKYLLDNEADLFTTDKHGNTPLHYAVIGNCIELVKLFRERGADLNDLNYDGLTPLLYSIKRNQKEMINCLLQNGADVNVKSARNVYPLKLLIQANQNALIKKVLKEEHIKFKGGKAIIRPAARTDILTPEEMDYINSI